MSFALREWNTELELDGYGSRLDYLTSPLKKLGLLPAAFAVLAITIPDAIHHLFEGNTLIVVAMVFAVLLVIVIWSELPTDQLRRIIALLDYEVARRDRNDEKSSSAKALSNAVP